MSPAYAREGFGVVVKDGTLDLPATEALRKTKAATQVGEKTGTPA